jgi:hypothetical protein
VLCTFLVCLFTLFGDGEQQHHGQHWLGHHGKQLQDRGPAMS